MVLPRTRFTAGATSMSSLSLPLAAHCQFASNDFDAMHAKLSSVLKPHDLRRLSNTPVSGLICRARLKRISLNVLRIGPAVDVAPGALDDFFLVQIPIRGAVDLTLGDERIRCERSMAAVISPGQRLQLRWSDNCTQLIVQIPREALQGCLARRLGLDSKIALKFAAGFNLDSAGGREWRALLDFIVRSVDGGGPCSRDPIGGDLEDLLLSALLVAQPHNHAGALQRPRAPAPFYVLRAEREMRGQMGQPLTVADLASAAGVSERTLHAGFRRFRTTTPMARLTALRLGAARRRLQDADPDTTVSRVAAEVGLLQFGRFAGLYRARFGELPSETLRASRRRRVLASRPTS
jgi:AraC-like DNA-binding protein